MTEEFETKVSEFTKAMNESLERLSKHYAVTVKHLAFVEGGIEGVLKNAMLEFYNTMTKYERDTAK